METADYDDLFQRFAEQYQTNAACGSIEWYDHWQAAIVYTSHHAIVNVPINNDLTLNKSEYKFA